MSTHSYSRLWTHLIRETLSREPILDKRAAAKASSFLSDYSLQRGIWMKINYFNADHVHALVDLPTDICVEEVIKLFKSSSSHWINLQKMLNGHFSWSRGYGAFSISHSDVERVARYIGNREPSQTHIRCRERTLCQTL